jgi:hypothetical protein
VPSLAAADPQVYRYTDGLNGFHSIDDFGGASDFDAFENWSWNVQNNLSADYNAGQLLMGPMDEQMAPNLHHQAMTPNVPSGFDEDINLQVAIAAPPPAPINVPQQPLQTRITCSHPGCYKSYVRPGDCRRHMLKHGASQFRCIFRNCDRSFHRADKLREHLKNGHKFNL